MTTGAKSRAGRLCGLAAAASAVLLLATAAAQRPLPETFDPPPGEVRRAEVVDRRGERLAVTYENAWNLHDRVSLHRVPGLMREAFVEAEDRRFFEHAGVDWLARGHAVWQNVRAGRAVRGASTITEQVVRMLHPRPRTVWSRWVEGFEAYRLEARFSKGEILEFYLNQLPFARQRRGIVQAASAAFDRDLDTLNPSEMLALAVLARSPSRFDLERGTVEIDGSIRRLGDRMQAHGVLARAELSELGADALALRKPALRVEAPHFVRYVRSLERGPARSRIDTPLDGRLQAAAQRILDERVAALRPRNVTHAAVLVVDHRENEVLAWVNARSESQIDTVLTRRQPGSTLKPFLYALALESGSTAATLIDDAPLSSPVGQGLHRYRNYSGIHRGPVRLREALGNSLNIPAIRAMQTLPAGELYRRLRSLGFDSLSRHSDFYGEGLALGNGEVSVYELVSAYAALARGGYWQPLRVRRNAPPGELPRRVLDSEVASLIADILSDPDARASEFGRGGLLDFPVQTAVKTGTSNDYRDAWAVGFSDRYTAGVWMGNLESRATQRVSGSLGPAVVLRGIFAELERYAPSRPLRLSRKLRQVTICAETGALAHAGCPAFDEWFRPANVPKAACAMHGAHAHVAVPRSTPDSRLVELTRPSQGLQLANDPRIPDALEAFEFEVASDTDPERIEWFVDGQRVAVTAAGEKRYAWPVTRGSHRASARVHFAREAVETRTVAFLVK